MESNAKKAYLPMGIENFEEMRTENFYYIDKTGMIRDLLENPSKVTLFTRPRRFGKTLNMSMLRYFFEPETDSAIFDGLEISKEKALCDKYMGKFPVISVTLKGAEGRSFDEAKGMLRRTIGNEAMRFQFLLQSDKLTNMERQQYKSLIELGDRGIFAMADELLSSSLHTLSQLLSKHYGQKAVLLIDEYDVPLAKAYYAGYYDEMVSLIRGLFGQALKTNDNLYKAVLTGCLRISKESIFTGLNNFDVSTVKDVLYNEYFGFTDEEVHKILEYYGFTEQYDAIKEWYDGYHFGNLEIYCPWDVINYCRDFRYGNAKRPKSYWVNTSSNDIVRMFIDKADGTTKAEIEHLINGDSVRKKIRHELAYRDIDSDIDNLWSILFTTGYLTQSGEYESEDGDADLVIPNKEIKWIYKEQIREWFKKETRKDSQTLEKFCNAFAENDAAAIEDGFNAYLRKTISIRDTNVKKEMKENFYHGILLGLLSGMKDWYVKSNAESGEGYSDISVEIYDKKLGIIIELKYAEKEAFDDACEYALNQINEKDYEEALIDNGMEAIYKYGIACYKKRCKVKAGQ